MRKFFDKLTWGFLFTFFVPMLLIMASWSSLPGDSIYPVKLALERVFLFMVSPSYAAEGSLQVKYTERRYDEVKQVLGTQNATVGLSNLNDQVASTKNTIIKGENRAQQKNLARAYIETLRNVSNELEVQKQAISQPSSPLTSQTKTHNVQQSKISPTRSQTKTSSSTITNSPPQRPLSQNNTPSPPPIVEEITQTQEQIRTTIHDLEKVSEPATEDGDNSGQSGREGHGEGPSERAQENRDNRGSEERNETDHGQSEEEHGNNEN